MRISDWSSDVCSSDLDPQAGDGTLSAPRYPLPAKDGLRDPGVALVSRRPDRTGARAFDLLDARALGLVRHGGDRARRRRAPVGPPRPRAADLAVFHAGKVASEAVRDLGAPPLPLAGGVYRSEKHTSELQSLMRI